MSDKQVDKSRRLMLTTVTSGVGLVGVGIGAIPFVASMTPSERAKAAGAPVEVDISDLPPGQMKVAEWRGQPVWIINRTQEMLDSLGPVTDKLVDPDSEVVTQQPEYAVNQYRSIRPEIAVIVGLCTHLGCSPTEKLSPGASDGVGDDWPGGFFCACHGSKFDLAGRVYKDVPAPTNLVIPPYKFLDENVVLIGDDSEETA